MLGLFLVSPLCHRLPYPVVHESCGATLNTSYYNLYNFKNRRFDYVRFGLLLYYVFRMCPPGSGFWNVSEPFNDEMLMKTNFTSPETFFGVVISQNAIDWRPLDPDNFSAGVILYAQGEPYLENGVWRTLDLEYWVRCDPSISNIDTPINFIVDDNSTTGLIIGELGYIGACPQEVRPCPTPMYSPQCVYVRRSTDDESVGIEFDLAELNDGPFGIKTNVTIGGEQFNLYYQPCERMTCPPQYNCAPFADT
jgi:hypothetical protein